MLSIRRRSILVLAIRNLFYIRKHPYFSTSRPKQSLSIFPVGENVNPLWNINFPPESENTEKRWRKNFTRNLKVVRCHKKIPTILLSMKGVEPIVNFTYDIKSLPWEVTAYKTKKNIPRDYIQVLKLNTSSLREWLLLKLKICTRWFKFLITRTCWSGR